MKKPQIGYKATKSGLGGIYYCSEHPEYQAKLKPRISCKVCNELFKTVQQWKENGSGTTYVIGVKKKRKAFANLGFLL